MNGVNDHDSVYSPLEDSTNQTILCHLNAQSLMNKMNELHSVLTGANRPVVLGVSETLARPLNPYM